jgi:uncharacterized coiled-coil protein SlyX
MISATTQNKQKSQQARFGIALLVLLLSGCSNKVDVECGGVATKAAIEVMLQKSLENSVRNQLDSEGSLGGYDSSKLRIGTSQIKVSLEEVRTIKVDPDSTRKFCAARLQLMLPNNVIEAADSTRALANMDDVKKLAHLNRIERSGNKYGRELEYSIQPTDDGKKIIAETDNDSSIFSFLTEVFASYLSSEAVKNQVIETNKIVAQEAQEEKLAEGEARAAEQEQALANLNEAKVQNRMANERINAVWANIPNKTKNRVRDLQRAWIRKVAAECKVEAAGKSEFSAEREAIRLRCDTRAQYDRADKLESLVSYEYDVSARAGDSARAAQAGSDAAGATAAEATEAAVEAVESAAAAADGDE